MGKVIAAQFISLDGYTETPNKELVPPPPTPDLFHYFIEPNLSQSGVFIYGRVTYEGMVNYWTGPDADPGEAKRLADSRKVVYSRRLPKADWGRATISRGQDLAADVAALRRETDRDLTILGSANLTNAFLKAGLIDGFRLLVTPLLLGGGTRLFQDNYGRFNLKLTKADVLDSGAVVLNYERG